MDSFHRNVTSLLGLALLILIPAVFIVFPEEFKFISSSTIFTVCESISVLVPLTVRLPLIIKSPSTLVDGETKSPNKFPTIVPEAFIPEVFISCSNVFDAVIVCDVFNVTNSPPSLTFRASTKFNFVELIIIFSLVSFFK